MLRGWPGLAWQIDRDRDVAQRRDREIDRIADQDLPRVERCRLTAAEGERATCRDVNRRTAGALRDSCGTYCDRGGAKGVHQTHADASAAEAGSHDHANRLIGDRRERSRDWKAAARRSSGRRRCWCGRRSRGGCWTGAGLRHPATSQPRSPNERLRRRPGGHPAVGRRGWPSLKRGDRENGKGETDPNHVLARLSDLTDRRHFSNRQAGL